MKLAFLDLETSGLYPAQHEIVEVGIVLDVDGDVTDEFTCSLPFDLAAAAPQALEVNGWGKRPFPAEMDSAEAVARVDAMTRDAFMVGNCPWFDDAFLRVWFAAHGRSPGWHYHLVDVENLIAGKLGLRPPWNSETVSEAVGISVPTDQHAALADARWSRDLYYAVFA